MTMLFALRTASWFGTSPGLCGGGGPVQYHRQLPTQAGTAAASLVGAPTAAELSIGFPCRNCTLNLGRYGGLCGCREFLVEPAAQLFKDKQTSAQWSETSSSVVSQMDAQALQAAKAACKEALLASTPGRLAWDVPALRPLLEADLDNCAIDKDAGIAKTVTTFNRAEPG